MTITKIAHLSDIHLRKSPTRNEEYESVFINLIKSLNEQKPDRIVIVGDLVHEYVNLQGEQLILASELLNTLALIAPVRITRGNHDYLANNSKRIDSIKAIVTLINNPNIIYYDKTGFYDDENITWAVWHHGEKNNNPWKSKTGKQIEIDKQTSNKIYIDLFHDPIGGCKSTTGFEMNSKSYYKISDFKSDYLLAGDIHLQQYLDKNKTKAYSGSLISQDFSEGDDAFHGYLLWDVVDKTVKEIPVYNEYSFKNIKITPYTDFDDLDYEISNPTKYMKIRFIWGTLPQTRNKENENKLTQYFNKKYENITISNKNEFIENEKIEVKDKITLENITNSAVQHKIFREYLEKIGTEKQLIEDIIKLDIDEINSKIIIDDVSNIEWNIIKFGCNNFMSYGKFDINWRDQDGIYQIVGKNENGKTTIYKNILYSLFNKTPETESRIKYGDLRYVNNRNGATSCDSYLVLDANGEYYGIKRRTEINKAKDGTINGAPTTVNYYLLSNPDEEMNENTSLEKLDEDRKVKTQKKIERIIGDYDNFMRIVMTTSDSLNKILSTNQMSNFLDELLRDSGLDIFDKKLETLKVYQKKVNEKNRITVDVVKTTQQIDELTQNITTLENDIKVFDTVTIPEVQNKVTIGKKYVEDLTKKLFKIDTEISNLNIVNTNGNISTHNKNIDEFKARETVLNDNIKLLKESYDETKLLDLIGKKDEHKTNEYNQKILIKNAEQIIRDEEHRIEIINGEIFNLKKDGGKYRTEIIELKESKTCPTCKQPLLPEHQSHVDDLIKEKEKLMFEIADQIKIKETRDKKDHQDKINIQNKEIKKIEDNIKTAGLKMEVILKQIGELTNDKNDVEKRKEFQTELNQTPILIQNEELKISILQQKIDNYNNSLLQIEENKKIETGIAAAKLKLTTLETEEQGYKEDMFTKKSLISEKQNKIKTSNELITTFKEQEYRDSVINLYKTCVHRDGIPTQMLSNYIIPKINSTLETILSDSKFKVWLDPDDLRPKLMHYKRPDAIIDCISACGKERTFSSIVLKFALNQINVKAKPMMFLLDEVMGKLDEDSVEEFRDLIHIIKNYVKKILVVEHRVNINPDYTINVQLDENDLSTLTLE